MVATLMPLTDPGRLDLRLFRRERAARCGERFADRFFKRAYWVCPLVAENEESDAAAAKDRWEDLVQHFGPSVGLIHGRMKGAG